MDDTPGCVGCIVVLFFIMLGGLAVYISMRCGWIS